MAFLRSFLCFVIVIAPLVLSSSGGASHYVPVTPRASESAGGVRAHVDRLDLFGGGKHEPRGARVGIVIDDAPDGTRILHAGLPPADEAACASLAYADAAPLREPTRPIHTGDALTFDFRGAWDRITDVASRIDLLVDREGERTCLSLDVTSPAPQHGWRHAGAMSFGTAVGGAGYTHAVNGSDATLHVAWLFGQWLGPMRLSLGTGIAADQCSTAVCPRARKGGESGTIDVPLYVHADYYFAENHSSAFGLGARYALIATHQFHLDGGSGWTSNHGIALAPMVAITAPNPWGKNGIVAGVRQGTLDLEIPVGIVAPLDDYRRPALSIGVALTLTAGF